ncbi:DndE family protein [Halomonas meridiana]|jgi:DNA sulfur modification protein DndE|uniref:DndE family protein n=1 Tax=Vreelandella aquamarina TaxID=77097 RepID=UPI001E28DA1C|nr:MULTISPECIES: DndE family protein [Halomonas]MCD1652050.1 DndE family protein [Halomonas axialensis]MCD2088343.1 DndE family protein [Halomonas meridiana]
MLPDRKIALTRKSEDRFKRIKQSTGQSVNQQANEKYFSSLENGYKVNLIQIDKPDMGDIKLEKATWLGECQKIVELTLKDLYPTATNEEAALLWALHVESQV